METKFKVISSSPSTLEQKLNEWGAANPDVVIMGMEVSGTGMDGHLHAIIAYSHEEK